MVTARTITNKYIIPIAFLSFANSLYGADWQIQPRVGIEEVFSDNVELTEFGDESSLVSLFTPGVNASFQTQRSSFVVDYGLTQAIYTHDGDLNDDYHDLLAEGRVSLDIDGLFAVGSASIRNVAANDARNSLADQVSGDTAQYQTYQLGLEYFVENSRYNIIASTNMSISEADDNIGEREGFDTNIETSNGSSARYVFWQGSANYSDYENNTREGNFHRIDAKVGYITNFRLNPFIRFYDEDTSGNVNNSGIQGTSSIGAGLRWLPTEHLFIDLSYNWVDEDEPAVGSVSEDQEDYLAAELEWRPSQRTRLSGKYYQRFFGDAYEFSFRHRTKRLTSSIRYTEKIDVFDRQELAPTNIIDIWCLAGSEISPENCVFAPDDDFDLSDYTFAGFTAEFELVDSNTFSLAESLTVSTSLRLPRSTITLTATHTDRTNLDFGDEDEYETLRFNYDRQITRLTNFIVDLSYRRNALNSNDDALIQQVDYYRVYRLGLDKQLNRTLEFSSYIQHLNRSSNRLGYSYEENRIGAQLVKRF
ncbi:TIGR03016 family PEP-CTERM system-associated outer membrane protein [Thalassotalea sp. HSM 43]|uniref:TIGR03016 family PEP-CTERM system-associated outer membrane protein n=1 Tax=Thalassotalea sp. HSM 43 TaxID=2552945 RepID=UPI00108226C9|nr:TIGR03016 family PEP-CTERM system-associated outer membrane protein [Thalassotalea sp. HSM 43]QBY04188.1 TIGR03016 family PEP-CTERM system-associated outer membrane protein [Thalassotalea sp. HSM 43]